jgi:two-component system chemotaxis response regulator CheY
MSNSKTLLIVDDSAVSRMMMKSILGAKVPDWTLLDAPNGQAALALCETHTIDYFSIDLNMPEPDGFQLIEMLKPRYPSEKMVLLTANVQDATHAKAKELGVACVNKPITDESMDQLLKALL